MCNQETARALRGTKDSVLHKWQAEARTRLWHLDSQLFSRKGQISQCMNATLTTLAELFQNSSASDAETASPQAETSLTEQPFSKMESCTPQWDKLPLSWHDLRTLLDLASSALSQALAERGVPTEGIAQVQQAMFALTASLADRRVASLEQELSRQREESVAIQHLTGRFLANASHELRTPLTAVLGFAELLLEETYGELAPDQRTAIGHIDNSAQNLLEIVNNLLDLLHIRAGKLKLQYRMVEIAPLLQNLFDILTPLAHRRSVNFTLDLPDNLGFGEMDEGIVRHIVYHLLASALRATPQGGSVQLSAHREKTALTILTHDTALHLPPDAVANMMDAFPILENSTARGYEGWEVGVPLVNRYVELHGGTLDMKSLPEQGTTFRITLPLGRTAKNSSEAA